MVDLPKEAKKRRERERNDERCGKSGADPGCRRRGRLLRQSRYLGDAFCRSAGPRRWHALRARPVRRRGDGRCRRLFPHEGNACLDAAASRSWPCQRPCQSAQRQEGEFRHRQHRRPARGLSHRLQRAADLGHRRPGAADVGLGPHLAGRKIGGARWRCRHRRGQKFAATDRDLDPARRYRME